MIKSAGRFCKGCKDKEPGCHDRCFAYQVAKSEYDAVTFELRKEKEKESINRDYVITKMDEIRRKHGKH